MLTFLLALELALGQLGQAPPDSPAKEKPYWLETAKQHIGECEVILTQRPENKLQPHAEPVFHHIQSTRGRSVGSVFLFVEASGRPAAVGDVFLFPRSQKHELYNEWHSLADEPLAVRWGGGPLMECGAAGLTWSPIPNASSPATSRTARERQLRQLARRFTAQLVNREKDKYELRLLTTPLYQFPTDDKAASEAKPSAAKPSGDKPSGDKPSGDKPSEADPDKSKDLGGGLFAFCQETDPEIFLLIEARATDTGAAWHWAAAEFSNLSLFLELDGKPVWKADPPQFSSRGPHFGGKLKDVDLAAPPAR